MSVCWWVPRSLVTSLALAKEEREGGVVLKWKSYTLLILQLSGCIGIVKGEEKF